MADEWDKVKLPKHIAALVEEYGASFGKEASMQREIRRKTAAIDLSTDGFVTTGAFGPPKDVVLALEEKIKEGKHNGYLQSHGAPETKKAVAEKFSPHGYPLKPLDAMIAVGAVHALDLALGVLCNMGQNILVPSPGSFLYSMLPKMRGVQAKKYRMKPENNYSIDFDHLSSLIDDKTAAILISNPSVPMGTIHSEDDLRRVLAIAEENCIPIISDEVFRVVPHPGKARPLQLASLSDTVPILECGGLDTFLQCDGWKLGWVLIHDRHGIFEEEVVTGLMNLCTRVMGAPAIIQGVVPMAMTMDLDQYHERSGQLLKANAEYVCSQLSEVSWLKPVLPSCGLFVLVGIDFDKFSSDTDFLVQLMAAQSVNCASGTEMCDAPGFFRINLSVEKERLCEAVELIKRFCAGYN